MLYKYINHNLDQLIQLLEDLADSDYRQPVAALSGASIGEHTRHIIEMYLCLLEGYEEGKINYDGRRRERAIERSTGLAVEYLVNIKAGASKENKTVMLINSFDGYEIITKSTYQRELLYNLEHSIHHQALIKVALLGMQCYNINEDFGVAPSTIAYRNNVYSNLHK